MDGILSSLLLTLCLGLVDGERRDVTQWLKIVET